MPLIKARKNVEREWENEIPVEYIFFDFVGKWKLLGGHSKSMSLWKEGGVLKKDDKGWQEEGSKKSDITTSIVYKLRFYYSSLSVFVYDR